MAKDDQKTKAENMVGMARQSVLMVGVWITFFPMSAHAASVDQKKVDAAIKQGVDFLAKTVQGNGVVLGSGERKFGRYPNKNRSLGRSALVGWALLEAGYDIDGKAMKRLVGSVRRHAAKSDFVYSKSLAILFLDAYLRHQAKAKAATENEPRVTLRSGRIIVGEQPCEDSKLIRRLGDWLVKNQDVRGGWGFGGPAQRVCDHTHTQYAAVAVYVATLHGTEGFECLARCSEYFCGYQNKDGGWGTTGDMGPAMKRFGVPPAKPGEVRFPSSLAMTLTGLVGIACGQGAQALELGKTVKNPGLSDVQKKVVERAFSYLNRRLLEVDPTINKKLKTLTNAQHVQESLFEKSDLFTLWSLQRWATMTDKKQLGKINWYAWGATILLKKQHADGFWVEKTEGDVVGTALAILFLTKANHSMYMTETIKAGYVGVSGPKEKKSIFPDLAPKADVTKISRDQLKAWRDAKGKENTLELANAVRQLTGETQGMAQNYLRARMNRMTAKTLRVKIQGEDIETCLASLQAIADKKEMSLFDDVVSLLEHSNQAVRGQSHETLKRLSGKDFGPTDYQSSTQIKRAINAWKIWSISQQ